MCNEVLLVTRMLVARMPVAHMLVPRMLVAHMPVARMLVARMLVLNEHARRLRVCVLGGGKTSKDSRDFTKRF